MQRYPLGDKQTIENETKETKRSVRREEGRHAISQRNRNKEKERAPDKNQMEEPITHALYSRNAEKLQEGGRSSATNFDQRDETKTDVTIGTNKRCPEDGKTKLTGKDRPKINENLKYPETKSEASTKKPAASADNNHELVVQSDRPSPVGWVEQTSGRGKHPELAPKSETQPSMSPVFLLPPH